jgi:hypothetical protein
LGKCLSVILVNCLCSCLTTLTYVTFEEHCLKWMNSKRRRLHKLLFKIITLSFHRITMAIGVLTKYFKRFNTTTVKNIYIYNNLCNRLLFEFIHLRQCSSKVTLWYNLKCPYLHDMLQYL